jgi:hypothetical protein
LVSEFGRGFADKGVRRMMQFAEAFPDREIVATPAPTKRRKSSTVAKSCKRLASDWALPIGVYKMNQLSRCTQFPEYVPEGHYSAGKSRNSQCVLYLNPGMDL